MYRKRARSTRPTAGGTPLTRRRVGLKTRTRRMRPSRFRRTAALGGRPDGIQRFNTGGTRTFTVNRTANLLPVITTGATPISALYSPNLQTAPLHNIYGPMFVKCKVNWIKFRFELTTFEQTDDSIMPTIYVKRNYDPDLTTVAFNQAYFMGLPGTIKKTFTATSNVLEIKFRPCVMVAGLQTGAGFQSMPRRAGYIDCTQDVTHYGLMYYVSPAGIGQTILTTAEWNVTYKQPR